MEMLEVKAADVETRALVALVADGMQGDRPGEPQVPHWREGRNIQWNSQGSLGRQQEPRSGRCGAWDREPLEDVTARTRERCPPTDPASL